MQEQETFGVNMAQNLKGNCNSRQSECYKNGSMIKEEEKIFFNLMSLAALILIALPVGIACIVLGFGMGDSPCVMCWAERITMIAIALIALFIVRYGVKPSYLAALILMACWGLFNGFIHYSIDGIFGGYLDIKQGFGLEILGAHTQLWVIVVNLCVFIFLAFIIFASKNLGEIMRKSQDGEYGKFIHYLPLGKLATLTFIVIVGANCLQAFITSGVPPYLGSSTPPRMSFDISKWFWEMDHWQSDLDFRFDWNPELPDLPN
ncbi:disulfide bond formation protein B [Campylobacter sp. faydin G-140]|uniref:disulfide bond formation protein B n=1 Tax=Campylobacter anatolicus TaxID=2829105 RepID=UPI001B9CCDCD|nr:disulfide bond formation protein B [Campylobacter anatolicus]MBR8466106.1 disulfide bond formation protein B [Campylobacter anatolicus]